MTKFNKHFLATGLVLLAGSLPAAAQARVDFNPGGGVPVAPPVASAAPSVTQLSAVEHRQRQQHPAAELPPSVASPNSGFDWGDAGVGAGGTMLLVGGGAAAVVAGRRRRTQRPLAG